MDKQTVYKEEFGYYKIQKEELLKKGYIIVRDTVEYTMFERDEIKKDGQTHG